MATLAISAGVNLAIGLLLNFLFPPKGQKVEGPRLSDLSVTSSAYGNFIKILYGTVRCGGELIWSPGIEEVKKTKKQKGPGKGFAGVGGGGGQSMTTYTYFASFQILFGRGVAENVLRIWADSKLIFDRTGTGLSAGGDQYKFRFYQGDEAQLPDALIEADKGVGNVPAHRGYCHMVAERWPLANFGNRIPNITAEITFSQEFTSPFLGMTEFPGQNIPGSNTGSDVTSWMTIDPYSDSIHFLKTGSNGVARGSLASMTVTAMASLGSLDSKTFCLGSDGFLWTQAGGSNFAGFRQYDAVTYEPTGLVLGGDGPLGTWGVGFAFPNGCYFGVLRVGAPELGVEFVDAYVISANSILGDGGFAIVYKDNVGNLTINHHITGVDIGRGGPVLQDRLGGRVLVLQLSDAVVDIWQVTAEINVGQLGPYVSTPEVEKVYTLTKGGTDLAGTDDVTGWCFLPNENAVILSNGISMCKLDLESGVVVAKNLTRGFYSKEQYSTNGLFAFGDGSTSGLSNTGFIYTISTDTLQVLTTLGPLSAVFGDGVGTNYQRGAYDPRSHSYIFSRLNGAIISNPRIVRILLDRANPLAVSLSDVVADICDIAGLDPSEYDVTDLANEDVLGYSITRQISGREAIEPLKQAYLFEGAESDWRIKFVRRGKNPVLTVDENDLGRLSTDPKDNPIKEVLQQEIELPSEVTVLYSDKDADYQQGGQRDKRTSSPIPSQYADNKLTLEMTIVSQATPMKQLAQRILYTAWNERLSIETVVPWRYIALDPTDVFNAIYRGETRRLRLSTEEVGGDLSMAISATQEDAASNTSTTVGSGGSGFPQQIIPSTLPTKLILLDLPLLLAADTGLQQFIRAYFAMAGYESSWPGGNLYQSQDSGGSFIDVGFSTAAVTWGRVDGTIGDPTSVYTWNETATINLQVANGIANFASATELEVLNGANAIAVIRGDGLPEIIQFQNVTQLDAGRVQISRLLRGRRGTEQNATGHSAAETWVLLDADTIETFQLELDLLNDLLQYRAPTIGTFIEDAEAIFFRYTGQDMIPYSPTLQSATRDGSGNLTVTWERRTRYNGELMDGTGEVPLNESEERYEVDFFYLGNLVATKSVTTKSATLTAAEFVAAGYLSGDVGLLNRSFETVGLAWTIDGPSPGYVTQLTGGGNPDVFAQDGIRFMFMGGEPIASGEVWQEINLTNNGWDANWIDDNQPSVSLAYYHLEDRASQSENTEARIEFRNAAGALISSFTSGLVNPSPDATWVDATPVVANMPVGTRRVRVRLFGYRSGIGLDSPEVAFDNIRLTSGVGVPQGITVKVYQISGVVGRGRAATAIV